MRGLIPLFIDAADLEKAQLRDATGKIFRRDLQKRGLERGPQMGLQFAQEIGHFQGRISCREAPFDERVGDAFVPTANGERVTQAQQAGVVAIGVGLGMQAGDDAGGNAVESVEPRDFLDEIDFAREIIPKGGRLPDRFGGARGGKLFTAEPDQVFLDNFGGDFNAEQAGDFFRAERDRAARRGRSAHDRRGGGNRRAGQFDEEGQRAVPRREQRTGIDAPFVAVGGIGDESRAGGWCGARWRAGTRPLQARFPWSSR